MRERKTDEIPILTLYLHYPQDIQARPTDTLALRYRAGQYELIDQYTVTPLVNGETIVQGDLSITVHIEDLHIASIESVIKQKQTYQQLADPVPTLQRLRELSPIETDYLQHNHKKEEIDDSLSFLNETSFTKITDDTLAFAAPAYPGYSEAKFSSLNQYFAPPEVSTPYQPSQHANPASCSKKEEGNILRDLGFT